MNRKQLTILLILVVILGGFGLVLYQRSAAPWKASAAPATGRLLADFPLNDVAHVRIKDAGSEVNVVRKSDLWTVSERGGYAANFSEISRLIRNVWELKPVQNVMAGPTQLGRLDLIEPGQAGNSGTLVEFLDASGKRIGALVLGKQHMRESQEPSPFGDDNRFPAGRYLRVLDGSGQVALISDPMSGILPQADHWIDKEFVKIEDARSLAVAPRDGEGGWRIERESASGEWTLADAAEDEKLDTSKISGVNWSVLRPTFTDVVVDASQAETGLDQPIVATIETFDGAVYNFNYGSPDDDNFYLAMTVAAPEKENGDDAADGSVAGQAAKDQRFENWTFKISKSNVQPLLQHRSEILLAQTDDEDDEFSFEIEEVEDEEEETGAIEEGAPGE